MLVELIASGSCTDHEERTEPSRVLWAAVLQRAIFDYVTHKDSSTSRLNFRTAERFLFSDDSGLVDICQVLGWPLNLMRARARSMTRNEVRKMDFRDKGDRKTAAKTLEVAHGNSQ